MSNSTELRPDCSVKRVARIHRKSPSSFRTLERTSRCRLPGSGQRREICWRCTRRQLRVHARRFPRPSRCSDARNFTCWSRSSDRSAWIGMHGRRAPRIARSRRPAIYASLDYLIHDDLIAARQRRVRRHAASLGRPNRNGPRADRRFRSVVPVERHECAHDAARSGHGSLTE